MRNCLRSSIYLAIVLILSSTVLYGQNYKSDVSKGDFALRKGDYEAAAKLYSDAIKSVKTLDKSNLDILYKLGFSQMQIKNYSNASVTFAQFINIAKYSSSELNQLKDVLQWKDWCDNEVRSQPMLTITGIPNTNIYLTNMRGLNSTLNDLSITLDSKNEIIFFTSNRVYLDEKKLIVIKTNLFSTEFQNNELKEPIKIGAGINSLGEIISACLASDNKTLYFTVANEDHTKADIYVCNFKNGKFEEPKKLPKIINTKYFEGYPSISNDGKSLYFVSDRPGGMGGKDIYVCRTLPDGTWAEPFNLGKAINTKYDEITPHIDKSDETLFFSSKGHPGNGGFDVFYSKPAFKGRWGEAINMVDPINSKADDIAYITTTDPEASYFSSSRKGGMGNFDIYKTGKTSLTLPIDDKPLIAKDEPKTDNEQVKIDTNIKQKNDFEEFKKITETDKQPQPVTQTVVSNTPPPAVETPKPTIVTQNTKPAPVQHPNYNLPLNKDTAILNSSMRGLVFRVQLGAFRNQITSNSSYFDKLNKNAIKEELSPEMLYKYTIGSFENINRATNAKQVLRDSGFSDAFLACYLEGKRVTMDEVLMMLDKKVYNRVAIYQK